jgi:hypothetical protein
MLNALLHFLQVGNRPIIDDGVLELSDIMIRALKSKLT